MAPGFLSCAALVALLPPAAEWAARAALRRTGYRKMSTSGQWHDPAEEGAPLFRGPSLSRVLYGSAGSAFDHFHVTAEGCRALGGITARRLQELSPIDRPPPHRLISGGGGR